MAKKESTGPYKKIVAQNKRAFFEYFIEEKFEAGIVLTGSEVKSLRAGKANIADGFADTDGSGLYLHQCHIAKYGAANRWNHEETRPRKLLMHKNEIQKLIGRLKTKGLTLVPLSMYFNDRNLIKVELGLGKGKKLHDKRETEKQRDWQRQKGRMLKGGE
jgi:SsrA-binding protein